MEVDVQIDQLSLNQASVAQENAAQSGKKLKSQKNKSPQLLAPLAEKSFEFPAISTTILERYNLRDISMNEVRALGKELREVGVLTAKQYMDFTTPWFGSVNIQTGEVVTNDTKMDYLAAFERVINFFKITDASDTETITNLENTQSLFLSLARHPA